MHRSPNRFCSHICRLLYVLLFFAHRFIFFIPLCKSRDYFHNLQILSHFFILLPPTKGIREALGRKNGSRADFRFSIGSNSNISSSMIVGFILSAKLQIKLGIIKSFAIKLRKSAISASFSFSYAIIQKINCIFAPASSRKVNVH